MLLRSRFGDPQSPSNEKDISVSDEARYDDLLARGECDKHSRNESCLKKISCNCLRRFQIGEENSS